MMMMVLATNRLLLLLFAMVSSIASGSNSIDPSLGDLSEIPEEFRRHLYTVPSADGDSVVTMVDVMVGVPDSQPPLQDDEFVGESVAQFERSNARVARMTTSELLALKRREGERFSYLEPDAPNHMHAAGAGDATRTFGLRGRGHGRPAPPPPQQRALQTAEVPWTLDRIQALDERIPRPSSSSLSSAASTAASAGGSTDECIKVCIVDSGVLIDHPTLDLRGGRSGGVTFDPMGAKWDEPIVSADHGSHVAGIIFGNGHNGLQGVAPNACLLVARVFGDEPNSIAPTSVTNRAIEWCADHGANIINLSYGTSVHSNTSETILRQIRSEGVLVVASSGNAGNARYSYPASYDDVISVASMGEDNKPYRTSQYNDQVNLCAPGVDINSTVPTMGLHSTQSGTVFEVEFMENSGVITEPLTAAPVKCKGQFVCSGAADAICLIEMDSSGFQYERQLLNCELGGAKAAILHGNFADPGIPLQHLDGGSVISIPVIKASMIDGFKMETEPLLTVDLQVPGYSTKIGTSFAAPHVAGIAALIWRNFPTCSNDDVREALETTALDVFIEGRDNFVGHGLVQAYDAYEYLRQHECANPARPAEQAVTSSTTSTTSSPPPPTVARPTTLVVDTGPDGILPIAVSSDAASKAENLREVNSEGRRRPRVSS